MAQPKLRVTHFAKHPRLAKAWTPETFEPEIPKVAMSKKADNGRFFENRDTPARGRFFDDMSGRDDGMFMGKTSAAAAAPGMPQPTPEAGKPTPLNIGATGAPMGGSGFRGQGMGGGMYGTGGGTKTAAPGPTSSPYATPSLSTPPPQPAPIDTRKPIDPYPEVRQPIVTIGRATRDGVASAPKASPSIRGGNTNLKDPRAMGGPKNEFSADAPKAKPRRSSPSVADQQHPSRAKRNAANLAGAMGGAANSALQGPKPSAGPGGYMGGMSAVARAVTGEKQTPIRTSGGSTPQAPGRPLEGRVADGVRQAARGAWDFFGPKPIPGGAEMRARAQAKDRAYAARPSFNDAILSSVQQARNTARSAPRPAPAPAATWQDLNLARDDRGRAPAGIDERGRTRGKPNRRVATKPPTVTSEKRIPIATGGGGTPQARATTWQDLNLASNASFGTGTGKRASVMDLVKAAQGFTEELLAERRAMLDRQREFIRTQDSMGKHLSTAVSASANKVQSAVRGPQTHEQRMDSRRAELDKQRQYFAAKEKGGMPLAGSPIKMNVVASKPPGGGKSGGMPLAGPPIKMNVVPPKQPALAPPTGPSIASNVGVGKRASVMDLLKVSAAAPSDGEAASDMPTGFHRPAHTQPEALEPGGERFHSTEGGVIEGSRNNQRHGLVEGGTMSMPATASPALGKHASVGRFMGTSFGIEKGAGVEDWASQRAGEFGGSLRKAIDTGTKSITQSPLAATVAALLAARIGARGVMKAGRFGKRLLKGTPPPPPPPEGFINKLVSGARTFAFGAKNLVEK